MSKEAAGNDPAEEGREGRTITSSVERHTVFISVIICHCIMNECDCARDMLLPLRVTIWRVPPCILLQLRI